MSLHKNPEKFYILNSFRNEQVSRWKLGCTCIPVTNIVVASVLSAILVPMNGEFLPIFGQFLASISLKQKKKKGAFSLPPLTLKSRIDAASVTAGAAKHSGSNEDHLAKVEISQRPRLQPSPRYVPLPQEQSSVINTPVITPPVCVWPYVSACTVSELAGTCTNIRRMSAMSLLVKGHHHCSPVRGEDSLSALTVKSVWSFSWRPCHPKSCVSNRALRSLPPHRLYLLKQRDDITSPH